jgi:hypothetical protein
MPNINQMKESRFLKKEDCAAGVLMTIRNVEQINIAKEGAPEELKWCAILEETDKPMVLNSTNNQIIAKVCGSENTDDWTGHKIVLFHDPNVSFAGKLIGGIRCRAPRGPAAAPKAAICPTEAQMANLTDKQSEDVPF